MDTLVTSSKKAKRIESKKKKAAAFLALIDHKLEPKMTDLNKDEKMSPETPNDDVLLEMKKIIRERKKQAMQKPKVFLTLEAMIQFRAIPDEPVKEDEIPPLYAMDLQQLLLYGLQGNMASYKPRWCKLLRVGKVSSIVLLVLEGISYNDYEMNKSNFPFISQTFNSHVEMVCPKQYMQTLESELYNVPLSVSQLKKVNVKVPKHIKDSVVAKIAQPVGKKDTEKFSRTCLLLSTRQMMLEGYPLPVETNIGRYKDFVFTKDNYTKVTANSPLFAVDCEMCTTTAIQNELTRVSIVSEHGEVIYDTLVKPKNKIINYLTRFSGITKAMLESVTTTLDDVQREIRRIFPPDAILCGQSLNGDLMALKMFHPYVIDTSVIFNMSGHRGVKAGLRKLTQFFLGRSIQDSKDGHSSAEDAMATLDLVKLKLTKGLEFGDATVSGVYFPDIYTYFMANENSSSSVVQNVEKDAVDVVQPALKISQSPSPSSCSLNKCKISCNHTQVPSEGDKDGKNSSVQGNKRQTTNNHSNDSSATHKSSSSSSSSSSEDEDDTERKTTAKKRKLTDSSGPGLDTNSNEEPEADASKDMQRKSVAKCKDFLFASTTDAVEQQKQCLFSQDNSVHVSHSFFRLVYEAGRTGCLIDQEANINKYSAEPIETMLVTSDTETRKMAKQMVQTKEFVWAKFHDYYKEMEKATQSRKEKLMRKLDNRVRSVFKHAKENALTVVVMAGRESDDIPHNMAVFVTTK